jgi:aldehyde dehydrogenase (NAD+)
VLLTRQLVHNSIRHDYVKILKSMLAGVKVGDPNDPAATMGPLIRADARDRTERYVDIAASEGARLVFGGRRPPALSRGYYFEPTLFDDVQNRSRIAQEEVFGLLQS